MEQEAYELPGNDVISGTSTGILDLDGELSLLPEFDINEELIEEVMQELYKEITCPDTVAVSQPENALSPALPTLLSAPSFSEGGKSESCGASVSDMTSSVMAGMEFMGGISGKITAGGNVEDGKGRVVVGEEWCDLDVMDGCDEVAFGDEWLDRVMEWGPVELEGWS